MIHGTGQILRVVGQLDVEAALCRHLVRQVTDKLAGDVNSPLQHQIGPLATNLTDRPEQAVPIFDN